MKFLLISLIFAACFAQAYTLYIPFVGEIFGNTTTTTTTTTTEVPIVTDVLEPENKQDLVDHEIKKGIEKIETSPGLEVEDSEAKKQKTQDSLDLKDLNKNFQSHSVCRSVVGLSANIGTL